MLTLDESVIEEKRVELESLCAALAADDPEVAGRVRAAGMRALDCAREFCEDGAAKAYTDMLYGVPRSLAVHRHVAFELIDLERTGDAAEIAAEAVQINPSDPDGYIQLAEVHRTLGLYAVAALAYREGLNLGAADEAEVRVALADRFFGLRLHEQAAANFELRSRSAAGVCVRDSASPRRSAGSAATRTRPSRSGAPWRSNPGGPRLISAWVSLPSLCNQ